MKKRSKITLGLGALAIAGLGIFAGMQALNNPNSTQQEAGSLIGTVEENAPIKLRSLPTNQGIMVTASVTSEYADINWSVAWASTNSAKITDYVSITPSEDTKSCEVKYIKQFDTQIVLTASIDDKSATCTVDCYDRITDYRLTFKRYDNTLAEDNGLVDLSEFTWDDYYEEQNNFVEFDEYDYNTSGTIDTEITYATSWSFTDDVKDVLDANKFTYSDQLEYSITLFDFLDKNIDGLSGWKDVNNVIKLLSEAGVKDWFDVTVTYTNKYGNTEIETKSKTYTIGNIDMSSAFITSSLQLDKTGIIF